MVSLWSDPVWLAERFPERPAEEMTRSIEVLREVVRLAGPAYFRQQNSEKSHNDRLWRGLTCPHCGNILLLHSHENQQHLCSGRTAFVKINGTNFPDMRRFYFAHDVFRFVTVQSTEDEARSASASRTESTKMYYLREYTYPNLSGSSRTSSPTFT